MRKKLAISRAKNQIRVQVSVNEDKNVRKLFVGGVPALTTFAEFKKYFQQFGALSDIMLPTKTKESKLNCGFGFVTFQNSESAKEVLDRKNQHSFRAKWVE